MRKKGCHAVAAALAMGVFLPGAATGEETGLLGKLSLADGPTSYMVFGGFDLGDQVLFKLLTTPWLLNTGGDFGRDKFVGAAVSHEVVRFFNHFSVEAELGGGVRVEPSVDHFSPEIWGAANLKYDGFPWNHLVRTTLGASIGLNWVAKIPPSEHYPGIPDAARLLIYTGPEIAFSLPDRPETELVFRIHHRSSGYGLMWGASSASDVFTIGLRFRR